MRAWSPSPSPAIRAAQAVLCLGLGGVALAASAGIASAQTPPGAAAQTNNLPTPPNGPGAPATGSFVANQSGTQSLGSDLRGRQVYDTTNDHIGDVSDVVIEADGRVSAVVIGVGGFLGIGTKDVAVPFTDLKTGNKDGRAIFVLNHTRDELQNAPAFAPAATKAKT